VEHKGHKWRGSLEMLVEFVAFRTIISCSLLIKTKLSALCGWVNECANGKSKFTFDKHLDY